MMVSNRNLLFQGFIFRGYVSFREGMHMRISLLLSLPCHTACHFNGGSVDLQPDQRWRVSNSNIQATMMTAIVEGGSRGKKKENVPNVGKRQVAELFNSRFYRIYRYRIDIIHNHMLIHAFFVTSRKCGVSLMKNWCSGPPLWEQWWGYDLCCRQGDPDVLSKTKVFDL